MGELDQILRKELNAFDSVFLILDALDEVPSAEARLEIIKIIHGYGPRVRIMVSSRRVDDIREGLEATVSAPMTEEEQPSRPRLETIHYEPLLTEIRNYAVWRINKCNSINDLVRDNDDLRVSLVEAVTEKSQQMLVSPFPPPP